eukprot:CAMPEP_0206475334 /NCGR_PEP_ID=MMETSP0324_2-20121206/34011_1 /ASSEMBLY_ACC=CAM_ASM_000836 /TAXON_ID=2866 /ORGANISM="Crypthecodinium cohnii, Strain Seligo" /LENGTH=862 /DNA_ID=CAMNT_0053950659 /DNA_START=44 /DNA_END=2629 /DNA_ORIENTATION=-
MKLCDCIKSLGGYRLRLHVFILLLLLLLVSLFGTDAFQSSSFLNRYATVADTDNYMEGFGRADPCATLLGPHVAILSDEGQFVALGNGFVCAVFDLAQPKLSELKGDFLGKGNYGKSVVTSGTLEVEGSSGKVFSATTGGVAKVALSKDTHELASIKISGIRVLSDNGEHLVEEVWEISLPKNARSLELEIQGESRQNFHAKAVRHSFLFAPSSIYGLFKHGVAQMKGHHDVGYYFSDDPLPRLYALGGSGADLDTAGHMSISIRQPDSKLSVLISSAQSPYSGFQDVHFASFSKKHSWCSGWSEQTNTVEVEAKAKWRSKYFLAPNDRDFPVQGHDHDLTTTSGNIPDKELQAMLTGIYASNVGQLCTHYNGVIEGSHLAQMATTIARPDYGYSNNYNFFDPDNYMSTTAMLFSGDAYLQEQVRLVLERNMANMKQDTGQLPHHFNYDVPQYVALSNEVQTGPNVFWILSCLNYVKATGNIAWLRNNMLSLRKASEFLDKMLNKKFGLLKVPGSLMIDVFIRKNFATDTNAMAVGFFKEFAAAEFAIGNTDEAEKLKKLSEDIAQAVDKHLWSAKEDDHYVTQMNPDLTYRDFVDYDANLIAVAHGVGSEDRVKKVLKRVDSGQCTQKGARATFVSERYYGTEDTTFGNIGDSWCTMGRIGWFDALARRRIGDVDRFDNYILDPLIGDVNKWTWLHERYHCDGTPQSNRTAMYFEYPAVTAMMVHFVRYGIQLGFNQVFIAPFGPRSFKYHVGTINVEMDDSHVIFAVVGEGLRHIIIDGLQPSAKFKFFVGHDKDTPGLEDDSAWPKERCMQVNSGYAESGADGQLLFEAKVGDKAGPCVIQAYKVDHQIFCLKDKCDQT